MSIDKNIRLLLIGDHIENSGPSNVNRNLIENSDSSLFYIHSASKIKKMLEMVLKISIFNIDVIIISGNYFPIILSFIKFFRKKMVVLVHGNVRYENEINNITNNKIVEKRELKYYEFSKRIIAVSENYSKWLKEKYPQFKDKITFVNNGIELDIRKKTKKIPMSIAVGGGNRKQKNNLYVCKAIEQLRKEGIECIFYIFGYNYEEGDDILDLPYVKYMGQLNKTDYYKELDNISLYIVNSELESFGLMVGDAMNCRCSMLISHNTGAVSILKLNSDDIIENPHDIDEIVKKIKKVFIYPNYDRIVKTIDTLNCDNKHAFIKLKKECLLL